MGEAPLKIVTRTQGNNRALKEKPIRLATARLEFVEVPVLVDAFRRMVRTLEFDICEMSLTTYLCAREHGVRFTALPIFLVRGFHHGAVVVDPNRALTEPSQLNGQVVGVNRGYTVTTSVWARGILARDYGVDLSSITWVRTGEEHVAQYTLPPNVRSRIGDGTVAEHVKAGDIAAAVGITAGDELAPLIKDPEQAGFAALRARGHYPINHLIVVRDDVLADRPGLAQELFAVFAESKRRYLSQLYAEAIDEPTAADKLHLRVHKITGEDPLPFGIEPNRMALEELVGYAIDQHILAEPPRINDLFAAGTQELEG